MTKFLPYMAILAMGLLGSGCCQFTGTDKPVQIKSTGGVVVNAPVNTTTPVGTGKIQVVYARASDATNHPTSWSLGGAQSNVGDAPKTVITGSFVVQFIARKPGDVPPGARVVQVPSGRLVVLRVSYVP